MEKQPVSAESIARLADDEQDVSSYFTNNGKMMPPLQNDGIDPSEDAIEGLNEALSESQETGSLPSHRRNPDRR
jgi:hypothetical protein